MLPVTDGCGSGSRRQIACPPIPPRSAGKMPPSSTCVYKQKFITSNKHIQRVNMTGKLWGQQLKRSRSNSMIHSPMHATMYATMPHIHPSMPPSMSQKGDSLVPNWSEPPRISLNQIQSHEITSSHPHNTSPPDLSQDKNTRLGECVQTSNQMSRNASREKHEKWHVACMCQIYTVAGKTFMSRA